jgi:hypothetical protein
MTYDYDQISIVVFTNLKNYKTHFNLFKFLVKDRLRVERFSKHSINECRLEGRDFIIRFSTRENESFNRGWKCHYALNLIEDKNYDDMILPMTVIHGMLDKEKWKELFE